MLRYCRPYPVERLRRFPALDRWFGDTGAAAKDGVLYLWDDLRVTVDPFADEPVFAADTEEWRTFCVDEMGFAVPTDLAAAMSNES